MASVSCGSQSIWTKREICRPRNDENWRISFFYFCNLFRGNSVENVRWKIPLISLVVLSTKQHGQIIHAACGTTSWKKDLSSENAYFNNFRPPVRGQFFQLPEKLSGSINRMSRKRVDLINKRKESWLQIRLTLWANAGKSYLQVASADFSPPEINWVTEKVGHRKSQTSRTFLKESNCSHQNERKIPRHSIKTCLQSNAQKNVWLPPPHNFPQTNENVCWIQNQIQMHSYTLKLSRAKLTPKTLFFGH